MRKKWIILITCFFCGVLLCGLGVGISLVEFSDMTYIGEQKVGEPITETLTYDITNEADNYYVYSYFHIPTGQKIISDNSVPADQIQIDVTYNSILEKPYIYDDFYQTYDTENVVTYDEYGNVILVEESKDSATVCEIYLTCTVGDFESFMKAKDIILADIKNNQIGSYRTTDDFDLVVRCNPTMADKIIIR